MAKKVVATLKTGTGKNFTKCIKMVKSDKTGAYMFKEGIIDLLRLQEAQLLNLQASPALFLTTEAGVAAIKEKEAPMPPMPAGPMY